MHIFAARHSQPVPGKEGRSEQGDRANARADDAQAPRADLAQRHRGGNPVEAPGEGQQDDEKSGSAGGPGFGMRHWAHAIANGAGKRGNPVMQKNSVYASSSD